MALLAKLIAALGPAVPGREHFLAFAQPALTESTSEMTPICGIEVDEQAGDVLLLCSSQGCTAFHLTLGKIVELLSNLPTTTQDYEVELTDDDDRTGPI
jgi:hypothetical protein